MSLMVGPSAERNSSTADEPIASDVADMRTAGAQFVAVRVAG
jgi:hypothetical protein